MTKHPDLIVFSHLRWNFVCQRPQHLLTRLAVNRRVFFVEEPVLSEKERYWEYSKASPNLTVCRPHTSVATAGFHHEQMPHLTHLISQFLVDQQIGEHIV